MYESATTISAASRARGAVGVGDRVRLAGDREGGHVVFAVTDRDEFVGTDTEGVADAFEPATLAHAGSI